MDVVKAATETGYDLQLRLQTYSEAVHDYKDNNLVNSCILQFPYGRGGLKEDRMQKDGSLSDFVDITEYTKYLSMISIQHFQSELFVLILYNMQLKHTMVKHATWKVREKKTSDILSKQLTVDDVNNAIEYTKYARGSSTNNPSVNNGNTLLHAVDAISRYVPHSNEATKQARRSIEAMQHMYGCPSFF
jgi:hypothetical protein